MYPTYITEPMQAELTSQGFEAIKTADDVTTAIEALETTVFVVVNSVCGCAAGKARPAAISAVKKATKKPNRLVTVFAGVDTEAVETARSFMLPHPPSSPSMALFKDGKLVHMIERHQIEEETEPMIEANLIAAFEEYCK